MLKKAIFFFIEPYLPYVALFFIVLGGIIFHYVVPEHAGALTFMWLVHVLYWFVKYVPSYIRFKQ
ncbi:hypothetical protein [Cronobacter sakazakii]|uniref:hypothetical protein n=1 Tax=Cronobacter sakazakii TaxID=28141 RepID=UPI000A1E41DB|nr:hypothetical protein [Cronobacter sakazakii]AZP34705.1 hypothetical protein DC438_16840 [Cronobacter sakazakii]ELY2593068.1 hypothetical protein [Cronobacter sakazakii]PUY25863.1 hypothetical protein BS421_16980 [Cronobacter sakazakii]